MSRLTIRKGAAHYDITDANGSRVDLSTLNAAEHKKAIRMIVGIITTQKD